MKFVIPKIALAELSDKYEEFENFYSRWTDDYEEISISRNSMTNKALIDVVKWLEDNHEKHRVINRCLKRINSYRKALAEADTKKVKRLVDIPATVIGFVGKNLPNQLVYKESDGVMLPHRVIKTSYEPARQDYPASATIEMAYAYHGEKRHSSIHLGTEDLAKDGLTILEILTNAGYSCETSDFNKDWQKSIEKYASLITRKGSVFVGSGSGKKESGDRYYSSKKYHFRPDQANKVVVDFEGYYLESDDGKFKGANIFCVSDLAGGKNIKLPLHPYGHVFHLEEHIWIDVHVDNIEDYKFKGLELLNKLVLPSEDKQLITILMEMSKMKIDDIVEGKTGGSFIMATGVPGTGKTLTAEVFSETIEKPLYKVQCSQLGINVEKVEKKLSEVLKRASRWGAIMLIDEADVYVRARETDINQNAIVGTFLRTLEYYTGILFMTSNMETAIDDAIMSRATAHLIYNAPSKQDQLAIWKVLGEQFDSELTDKDYSDLADRFDNLVGRDIKALLKLAMMYAKGKQEKLSIETFEKIYRFVPNVVKNNKS